MDNTDDKKESKRQVWCHEQSSEILDVRITDRALLANEVRLRYEAAQNGE